MAVSYRKARVTYAAFRRFVLIAVLGVILLVLLLRTNAIVGLVTRYSFETDERLRMIHNNYTLDFKNLKLPRQNELSISFEKRNLMAPRNLDLYPELAKDHIVIVFHDGYFEEMNKIVESIKFCQVKQIFAPYSPHIFPNRFPGVSPFDCKDKDDPAKMKCKGTPDQYGNHRSPKIVSLKHHWWWMMNTVWDGLKETSQHSSHILFIEEDHFIHPNAYRNLQLLTELKPKKCPYCYAANLAPSNVVSRGEGWEVLIAERMGNVGYAFNLYPSFGEPVYTLRGPRTSAVHFGKCGLHQGRGEKAACVNNGVLNFEVKDIDRVPNVKSDWGVYVRKHQEGWGDMRDRQLCLDFANMYRASEAGEV
ncbi:hypothetical protein Pfo_028312 [Paulownia fortunei]|nr:hypothetical protein Pfo_028312 [Paulownia fortunei]